MIFGMTLGTYTFLHVLISLVGIGSGQQLTRGLDACTRAGPILFRSCKPPRISLNYPKPS